MNKIDLVILASLMLEKPVPLRKRHLISPVFLELELRIYMVFSGSVFFGKLDDRTICFRSTTKPICITAGIGRSSLWFYIEVSWGFNGIIKWTDAWGPQLQYDKSAIIEPFKKDVDPGKTGRQCRLSALDAPGNRCASGSAAVPTARPACRRRRREAPRLAAAQKDHSECGCDCR